MTDPKKPSDDYFALGLQISGQAWHDYELGERLAPFRHAPAIMRMKVLADCLNQRRPRTPTSAGELNLVALLENVFQHLIFRYFNERGVAVTDDGIVIEEARLSVPTLRMAMTGFVELFPPQRVLEGEIDSREFLEGEHGKRGGLQSLCELFILAVQRDNPALVNLMHLFDDSELARRVPYREVLSHIDREMNKDNPLSGLLGRSLSDLLSAPIKASPGSLHGQLSFIQKEWSGFIPPDISQGILTAFDVVEEEHQMRGFGQGPTEVLTFGRTGYQADFQYPEPEAFTADADWMSNVVLIAKSAYVWLDQLSKRYQRPITRVDQIPDEELDKLARWGINSLWLIGIWERSSVSQWIKHMRGNPEALASAYSLYDYTIAHDLGGEEAMAELERRCWQRGICLASDIVPNHTGLYSRWVKEHPDWYVQLDYPPYPGYTFTGQDLSPDPEISLQIEDGYYDHSDAAVAFKYTDHRDGRVRYMYHGNDGTHMPWNDTAQLNYLIPEVREAMVQTILHIARRFKVIRFDAAMTLAKKHFQRLWFPQPGGGAGVPSRAEYAMSREDFEQAFPKEFWREVVDRINAEVPDCLLIAEAFWLMEGYFVRTLGMHRVYNSAFMNMLKNEENAKYRQTVKNIIEFNHEILKRFTNFMNNPDEATAVEQFGRGDKFFGVSTMLVTMPGLPMIGHGQIEGLAEKYGMEYSKAYWNEPVDEGMVRGHEWLIFPLMRKRYLFSGSQNFRLYDFHTGYGVNEDVFAYSNRAFGERGLVIFHNKYAQTSGTIHESGPVAMNPSDENINLESQGLGQALELNGEENVFYRFREHCSGLEYLRSGAEIHHHGFHVELGAYEAKVFLDWQEIHDTEGIWRQIHSALQGRPSESLDAEWRHLRYADLIEAARALLAPASLAELNSRLKQPDAKIKKPKETIDFDSRMAYFLDKLIIDLSLTDKREDVEIALEQDLAAIRTLAALKTRRKTEQEALAHLQGEIAAISQPGAGPKKTASSPYPGQKRRVLLPWLLFHRLGELRLASDYGLSAVRLLEEALLDRVLYQNLQQGPTPFDLDDAQARAETRLTMLLIRHQPAEEERSPAQAMQEIFNDSLAKEYLGCNWHARAEWFNKERFENLAYWLEFLQSLHLTASAVDSRELLEELARTHGDWQDMIETAATSSYQVEPFCSALTGENTKETRPG